MDETALTQYITDTLAEVETTTAMGYRFFFLGQERKMPFATIALEDSEYDSVSNLKRGGLYRLNLGVSRDTYRALFGSPPARLGPAGIIETGHDFGAVDVLMPHPVYAPQGWVCVLNPGEATWERVKPLLAEAYDLAVRRQGRREARDH